MHKIDLPFVIFKLVDRPVDLLVNQLVNYDVVSESIPVEKEHFLREKPIKDQIEYLNTMLGAIHSRASAAISHISIMMGVTILLMIKLDSISFIKLFMIAEIVIYSVLLILCLRCVRSMTLNGGRCYQASELEEVYDNEIVARFAVLQLVNAGLVVATVLFLILIVIYGIFV